MPSSDRATARRRPRTIIDSSIYNGDDVAQVTRIAGPKHLLARSPSERFNLQFGSTHPGVCQFVFGDGSVRLISVSTPGKVLQELATRCGGRGGFDPELIQLCTRFNPLANAS